MRVKAGLWIGAALSLLLVNAAAVHAQGLFGPEVWSSDCDCCC